MGGKKETRRKIKKGRPRQRGETLIGLLVSSTGEFSNEIFRTNVPRIH